LTSVLDTHPCHKNGRFCDRDYFHYPFTHQKNESNKYFIRYKIGVFPIAFFFWGWAKIPKKGKHLGIPTVLMY
jgi:hypothetical protein